MKVEGEPGGACRREPGDSEGPSSRLAREAVRCLRTRRIGLPAALFSSILSFALAGCASPATPVEVRLVRTHKDVLELRIDLEAELEPLGYLNDASLRVDELTADPATPPALYEIRLRYASGRSPLAEVVFRAEAIGRWVHERTLIHPAPRFARESSR